MSSLMPGEEAVEAVPGEGSTKGVSELISERSLTLKVPDDSDSISSTDPNPTLRGTLVLVSDFASTLFGWALISTTYWGVLMFLFGV